MKYDPDLDILIIERENLHPRTYFWSPLDFQ